MFFRFNHVVKRDVLFLSILSVVVITVGASSIIEKSVTWDEPFYMGVGYYLLKTGNFFVEPIICHPPLSYYINSLPFYLLDVTGILPQKDEIFVLDKIYDTPFFDVKEQDFKKSRDCFYCYAVKHAHRFIYGKKYRGYNLLFYSRCSMLLLLILSSIYLFRFVKEYYGFETACIITTLFALNPNIIAHARLATTDITPVCFNLISFYYFTKFMEEKTIWRGIKAGIGLGLALLSKSSSIYLIVVYILIMFVEGMKKIISKDSMKNRKRINSLRKNVTAVMVIALFTLITLNTGYLFKEVPSKFFGRYGLEEEKFIISLEKIFYDIPLPISEYYLFLVATSEYHLGKKHETYLLGESYGLYKDSPNQLDIIKYWTTTLFLKTPEAVLILILLSLIYYSSKILRKQRLFNSTTSKVGPYIILNLLVFTTIMLNLNILIGIRLILPIFPLIYFLMGEPVRHLLSKNTTTRTVVYMLVAASLLPVAVYHPHYIAYFNQLIGGPENGYRYLSDSNIDWGQDLPGLKRWMDEHNISKIKLAYFGRARIEEHGINYISLPDNQKYLSTQRKAEVECGPTTSVLAISVTTLTGQYGNPQCYEWLNDFEPVDNIGYSILIYNITEDELPD